MIFEDRDTTQAGCGRIICMGVLAIAVIFLAIQWTIANLDLPEPYQPTEQDSDPDPCDPPNGCPDITENPSGD